MRLREENGDVETPVVVENRNSNFPAIWSEEGKYLASVLGDALVKGLTLVSQERPGDPVEYLANFLRGYSNGEEGEGPGGDDGATIVPAVSAGRLVRSARVEEGNEDGEDVAAQNEEPTADKLEESIVEEQPPRTPTPQPQSLSAANTSSRAATPNEDANANEEDPGEQPPDPPTESDLNADISSAYERLEDAMDETTPAPFDPEKEEREESQQMDESGTPADDPDSSNFANPFASSTRDETGQSVLHFASTRPGGASTILAFLQNPSVNLAWRDSRLRTARDIANDLGRPENARVIDNWVVGLSSRGEMDVLESLLMDGYDHLADVEEVSGAHIVEVAESAGKRDAAIMLRGVPEFREKVERVHRCVRGGDQDGVVSLVSADKRLAYALSSRTGRCALHVAVLCEEVGIVKWIGENVPEALKRGDNLERTCLHYAMGVDKVEKIVRILVRAGAKRVVKDLRNRQPSWYFINRDEIGELQAEERAILN